jgi:DNA-binding winged helix-turn-helix (wHTH) protein/TolB-like protein/Tfp pilus assembly protein PilF
MSEGASIFEFGPFGVDVLRRSLKREGQPIALSGKAFEILVVLLEQRGDVVDKDALMRRVWPDTAVEEINITVAISGLRKALGETPASPEWIVTIPGRGYTFVGEVRSDPPTVAETAPQTPPIPQAKAPERRSRTRYLFVAGALLIALAAYVLIVWVTPKPLRSVAILPFGVLNQDGKNDYLGLGLTDAVITRLGNTHLVVRPLATVSRFAGRDPIQTGRDLGVEAVVEGSIQTAANRIRVSVHLLRVRDGKSLWAQTFDVASDNAFALEDSISERVASNLSGHLTGQEQSALNKRPTPNASAYGNYLRGRYYALKYTEDGFRKALDYLQSAVNSDPAYALAYSGLADTFYDGSNLIFPPNEAMPRAKAAAQRAVELDPSLAAAHVSLGLIASGSYRAQMGDFNRAIVELRRAQELDPLSGEINAYVGLVMYWARRYDDSINQLLQAITFDPTFVPNYVILCWALDAKGDTKAALDACKQALERQVNPWTTLALARARALAGDHVTAAATMASLAKQAAHFVSGYDRAAVYAALGRTDDAFVALEEAYQSRAEWMAYLKVDPQMDTLRRDPRYSSLLRRLAFQRP